MKQIYVIYAHFEAKPETQLLVKDILHSLVEPTRKEEGCLKYDFYFSQENPCKILLHEYWRDEAAHARHMLMPYVQSWQIRKNELLLNYYDFVGTKSNSSI